MGKIWLDLRWLCLISCYIFLAKLVSPGPIPSCRAFIYSFGSLPWGVLWLVLSPQTHQGWSLTRLAQHHPQVWTRPCKPPLTSWPSVPHPGRWAASGLTQVWELQDLGGRSWPSSNPAQSWAQASDIGLWLGGGPRNFQRRSLVARAGSRRGVGKESSSQLPGGVRAALRKWGCWAKTWCPGWCLRS